MALLVSIHPARAVPNRTVLPWRPEVERSASAVRRPADWRVISSRSQPPRPRARKCASPASESASSQIAGQPGSAGTAGRGRPLGSAFWHTLASAIFGLAYALFAASRIARAGRPGAAGACRRRATVGLRATRRRNWLLCGIRTKWFAARLGLEDYLRHRRICRFPMSCATTPRLASPTPACSASGARRCVGDAAVRGGCHSRRERLRQNDARQTARQDVRPNPRPVPSFVDETPLTRLPAHDWRARSGAFEDFFPVRISRGARRRIGRRGRRHDGHCRGGGSALAPATSSRA